VRADSREVDSRSRWIAAAGLGVIASVVAGVGFAIAAGQRPKGIVVSPPSLTPSTMLTPNPTPVPSGPVAGSGVSIADDPATQRVVLFGGVDSSDKTWLWDGRHWTSANPRSSPPIRSGAAIAYDPVTRLVLLFGGAGPIVGQVEQQFDDTWAWDGATWRRLASGGPDEPPGDGASMAWDAAQRQMLLVVAGETDTDGETWTWDGTRWIRDAGGDVVALVIASTMAYDPVSKTVLMVTPLAGDNEHSATFGWNGSSWHELVAEGPDLDGLAAAQSVNGLDEQVNDAVVACGSVTSSANFGVQATCWEWATIGWFQLQEALTIGSGTPVTVAAEVDDVNRGQLLIFGWLITSVPNQAEPLYVWAWDGIKWTLA
jgi:hypothetical protein